MTKSTPPFRRLLVPLADTTSSQRALIHALSLARAFSVDVSLLHFIEPLQTGGAVHTEGVPVPASAGLQRKAVRRLAVLSSRSQRFEVTVHRQAYRSPVDPETVVQEAHAQNVDLIVMGTGSSREKESSLISPAAREIVHQAPCSVLTVGLTGGRVPEFAQRILVPVDFSASTRETLRLAQTFAHRFDAELLVLHVIEPFAQPHLFSDRPGAFALRAPVPDEQARKNLSVLVRREKPKGSYQLLTERARPVQGILSVARRYDAHLIMLGARGCTSLDDATLGNVAKGIVRAATCPVLTVRGVPSSVKADTREAVSASA